jgi:hypothetical protein
MDEEKTGSGERQKNGRNATTVLATQVSRKQHADELQRRGLVSAKAVTRIKR